MISALPIADDQAALLALVVAGGPLAPRRHLLDIYPNPAQVLEAGLAAWCNAGCTPAQCARLASPNPTHLRNASQWLTHPQHHLIGWNHADYPPLLKQIAQPPCALFIDGDPLLLWHPCIAIVGTRRASVSGKDNAYYFANVCARSGLTIVSGMAAGIDAFAHHGALETADQRTIAVLGCGPDYAYPSAHSALRDKIAACGAVVSEYPPGTRPYQAYFPARNRIVAGLTMATVVIEAPLRSGALITARLAAEAGREVFALPGSIQHTMSRGCNALLRQGAALLENPAEIILALDSLPDFLVHSILARLGDVDHGILRGTHHNPRFSCNTFRLVWQLLDDNPVTIDTLAQHSGLEVSTLSAILLSLEIDGYLCVENAKYFRSTKYLTC